jgi:hypothetical protein
VTPCYHLAGAMLEHLLRGLDLATLCLLVDVDGVLTDRDARPDVAAIGLLVDTIEQGALVALVTGRSKTWLEHQIHPHFEHRLTGRGTGHFRLWRAAEYGAIHTAGLDAPWCHEERFAVPTELRASLMEAATAPHRDRFIEWDASKERMATVEARHGADSDDRHRIRTREVLHDYFQEAERLALPLGLNVVAATYAVDVTSPGLTKRVGADWALEQFASTRAGPSAVVVLGDSGSDIAMAHAAVERGVPSVRFVWLGERSAPSLAGAKVVQPSTPFGAGTREALSLLLKG